ncbi:L-serine ammonia-lyase, iron-sulfur-dependent, subunit alpha [Halarsenatibacter silvermanii]|uniref:L-serine dehydratase n=1 Tax=Halarsenatibacter silvermanii TaxID=321763 RepID=A0A1G9N3E9_9FIRM|nr:L-serine ammonia-lyase, iron-sulfur-dependent, subunit alpha [Halarsenatibacter silvermanii]SDL80904.1 L-serine dehydratase [Halarsenatibacter silvermanii]
MIYSTFSQFLAAAENENKELWEVVLAREIEEEDTDREKVFEKLESRLNVMEQAIETGIENTLDSQGGLVDGEAARLAASGDELGMELFKNVNIYALATAEVNASMGKIIAAPTAGASGVVPAVILALAGEKDIARDRQQKALLTAAGLGEIAARKATVSGAAGGCQAECGVAAGMAAGAGSEMLGGRPKVALNAFTLALKNLLGLACDPVGGLVEVPCVKRNATSASCALSAILLAMSGIESTIPADEVVKAMREIGDLMPSCLKETAEGGLANTETARKFEKSLESNK